jgi:hypothetical protein
LFSIVIVATHSRARKLNTRAGGGAQPTGRLELCARACLCLLEPNSAHFFEVICSVGARYDTHIDRVGDLGDAIEVLWTRYRTGKKDV